MYCFLAELFILISLLQIADRCNVKLHLLVVEVRRWALDVLEVATLADHLVLVDIDAAVRVSVPVCRAVVHVKVRRCRWNHKLFFLDKLFVNEDNSVGTFDVLPGSSGQRRLYPSLLRDRDVCRHGIYLLDSIRHQLVQYLIQDLVVVILRQVLRRGSAIAAIVRQAFLFFL